MTQVISRDKMVNDFKYIEANRYTLYNNNPPYNCGRYNEDGSLTADCWCFFKAEIWSHGALRDNFTVGKYFYVDDESGLGDWIGRTIMDNCTDVSSDFRHIEPGEVLLYYDETHWGNYVGDYTDPSGIVNVVEWTTDFGGGCVTSYVDEYGNRWNHKGGYIVGSWKEHGKPTKWVSGFNEKPQPVPEETKFAYQVMDDINKVWLPDVINDSDYAGIFGSDVDNVYISCNAGDIEYCVHTWGGDAYEHYPNGGEWLPWVKNREDFAGDNIPIDGIAIKSDKPCEYQVHLRKSNMWLERVSSKDTDLTDDEYGYAGIIGEPIDAIMIRPF